jgi:TonB-linked SusC/RagA family outer membrane protein
MKKTALLLCAFIVLGLSQVFAQNLQITGHVTSTTTNQPLLGATVLVKGSSTATTTDENGNFKISAPKKSILVISFTGMTPQERIINAAGNFNFNLSSTNTALEEVVVVGYGTQKKSVVTGAISSVKAKDLENVPNGRIEQSLQGRVAGVTIAQNAGQPGSNSTIRVRGITTFGSNDPLWVVDGIVVNPESIAFINQSDIESIEVLKDATSAAIYGTRAAAGVILVTTKKGKAGKINFSYNGYYGTSAPAKKLDLLNATEYATLMNERSVAGGGSIIYPDPTSFGKGTDWQKEIFNNDARRSNNEFSLSGGNNHSTYYLSFNLQDQQGIVATDISHYNKKSIRINSTHKLGKYITVGETGTYAHQYSRGLGNTNSEFGGPLSSAINLDPITPVVVTDPAVLATTPYNNPNLALLRNSKGYPYGISSAVGQEMSNPKAYILTRLGNYGWSDDFIGNAFVEIAPTKNIKFRSVVSGKLSYYGDTYFNPEFYLSPTINLTENNYGKNDAHALNWSWENTVQYNNVIGDHDFSVLLGTGAYVEGIGGGENVTLFGLPITSYQDASFNFPITQVNRTSGSYDITQHKISSLFGRVNYNYKEKYLFTGIMRRDGSNKFGPSHKYGYFPSGSLGWVVSKEDFWPENKFVNTLKLRGGYGKVGNDANIGFNTYVPLITGGYNYTLGNGGLIAQGYAPNTLANPDLHWESTAQTDVGFDAQVLKSITIGFDVYKKNTTGILRYVPIPGYVGVSGQPTANIASMVNNGVELEVGYHHRAGEVNFGANGNVAFLKNKVTYINSDANFISGDASFQSMGAVTRTQVGQSYNSFYGYKTMGIFQSQDEINAYTDKLGNLIQPNATPGDFRWQDTNGDGVITEADKTFLGSNIPKVTFGLTLTAEYKGFDAMVFGQGATGNKIFQGLRRLDIATANFQTKALGRWSGPGTSNSFPRLTSDDTNGNFTQMSDFYLEKGDYLRLKVVQVGYTFHNNVLSKWGLSKLRVYVTGENLLTLTNYTGYDPEIGGGVFGIDKGYYPQARSFLFGAQIQF